MPLLDWVRTAPRRPFPRSSRRAANRVLLRLERVEDRVTPATLTVNSLADNTIPGDGLVTFREAIQAHNNNGTTDLGQTADGNDVIQFAPGLTGTITLTQGELLVQYFTSGSFTTSLDIQGPGAGQLTVSGNSLSRVFENADANSTLTLSNLTVSDGVVVGGPGGGGILNSGTLRVDRCVVTNNFSNVAGPTSYGGGILNQSGATLTLSQTLVSNNSGQIGSAALDGGGVASFGNLNVQNCTFTGNSVDNIGGALFVSGSAGTATLTNVTIVGNSAGGTGGGVFLGGTSRNLLLQNTLVAGNVAASGQPQDLCGSFDTTSADNLIGVDTSFDGFTNGSNGNQIGKATSPLNPLVAPLGNYGGPTQTVALLPGSPALGAGGNFGLTVDQRGNPRRTPTDIGAFQSSGFTLTLATGSTPQSVQINRAFPNPLALTVTSNNPLEPVAGGQVIFAYQPGTTGPGGAGANLSGPGTISPTGGVSVPAFAGDTPGSYSFLAGVDPFAAPVRFDLTNIGIVTNVLLTMGTTNPNQFGDPVFLTATAMGADGSTVASGQIDLTFDGTPIGSIVIGSTGGPSFVQVPQNLLTVGTHAIAASYNDGEITIAGSQSSLPFIVDPDATTTTINVNPTSLNVGDPVTVTGMVTLTGSGQGRSAPTGTVTLVVNGEDVATEPLNGTNYSFTTAMPTGTDSVQVRYDGDATNATSISNAVSVMVNGPSVLAPESDQTALEGTEQQFDLGSFSDSTPSGPYLVVVDWGDGTQPTLFSVASPGLIGTQSHTYQDTGTYTVTVIVGDPKIPGEPQQFTVRVDNVAPTLIDPLPVAMPVSASGVLQLDELRINDPGANDVLQVVIDWGDGSTPTVIQLAAGQRTVSADMLKHTYASTTQVYRLSVTVTDKDGGSDTEVSFVNATFDTTPQLAAIADGDFLDRELSNQVFGSIGTSGPGSGPSGQEDDQPATPRNLPTAVTPHGADAIRVELPRFGPPIGRERSEPRLEAALPPAPVPGSTRVGETPPPSSPLNEKSPLGTPINLFNSVFDSDDSANLIDSLRRDLSKPKPSIAPSTSPGNVPGGGSTNPMSMLNPPLERENPSRGPNWLVTLALGMVGAMWWNHGQRRWRREEEC